MSEFWKDHFNILICVELIDNAWNGVSQRTTNSARRDVWHDCVLGRDFEWSEDEPDKPVIEEIVSLGTILVLEQDDGDVEERMEEGKRRADERRTAGRTAGVAEA